MTTASMLLCTSIPATLYILSMGFRCRRTSVEHAVKWLSTVSCYRRSQRRRRTLIGSNACSGSARRTDSNSPLQRRPRPAVRHSIGMRQRFKPVFVTIRGPQAHIDGRGSPPHGDLPVRLSTPECCAGDAQQQPREICQPESENPRDNLLWTVATTRWKCKVND
jgi:hypothetical protein